MKNIKLLKFAIIALMTLPTLYFFNAISQPKQASVLKTVDGFEYMGTPPVFYPLDNFCDLPENQEECTDVTSHTFDTPPDVIFMIHGMDSSMNSWDPKMQKAWGLYIRMAQFLKDLGGDEVTIYGVDYNSNGRYCDMYPNDERCLKDGKLPIFISELNTGEAAAQCSGQQSPDQEWLNCWNLNEGYQSDRLFDYVNDITVQSVANAIRTTIVDKMADELKGKRVMIIGHSMGGLVTRDLLYGPGVVEQNRFITTYEQLRNLDIEIAEVVLLAVPNDGGMFYPHDETDDLTDIICAQIEGMEMSTVNQYCALQAWRMEQKNNNTKWANGKKLEINRVDFPQIQWTSVGAISFPGPMSYQNKPVATDSAVPIESAFDIINPETGEPDYKTRFHHYVPILEWQDHDQSGKQYPDARPAFIKQGNSEHLYDGYWDNVLDTDCGNYPNHKNCPWAENIDALHASIPNVSYYPDQTESCSYHDDYAYDEACHIDPQGQKCKDINEDRRIGCYGWFQYTIPFTSLCLAEGYNDELPYYQNNPQSKPSTWGCVYQ